MESFDGVDSLSHRRLDSRCPPRGASASSKKWRWACDTFTGVLGRDSDILVTPDGVKVTGISHFQRDVANIVRIQVIQESASEVVILVLPMEGYSDRDRDRLMHNAREKLPRNMHVEIRSVTALERTARGKTPFVIHRAPVKELLNNTRAHGSLA